MKDTTMLEIDKIKVVETTFDDIPQYNRICFEWVERSSYCMYPDEEVSIDIERDDAININRSITEPLQIINNKKPVT